MKVISIAEFYVMEYVKAITRGKVEEARQLMEGIKANFDSGIKVNVMD